MDTRAQVMTSDAARRDSLLGTGLGAADAAVLLAASVAVFLFWDEPLWSAPAGASHAARIAVSYLLVVPLAAAALALRKRWSAVRLLSATALLWSAKLVVTASLYSAFAAGSASRYTPARAAEPAAAPQRSAGYRPAPTPRDLRDLSGTVLDHGAPAQGAIVWLDAPPPGRPPPPAREIAVNIEAARYSQSRLVASPRDRFAVTNLDPALHTFRFIRDGAKRANVPIPPRASAHAAAPEPGAYTISCENHPTERAMLVVVDHPYAVLADAAGRFVLAGAPAGDLRLAALRDETQTARRTIQGGAAEVRIELSEEGR
jgi:plastocyanin